MHAESSETLILSDRMCTNNVGLGPPLQEVAATILLHRNLANHPARVAGGEDASRDVAGDDAAGADDGAIADRDAGADDRAAADPDVVPDSDRLGELLLASQLGVHRMRRRVDLHGRAEERAVADRNLADVEHDAVEIEEHTLAEMDVRTVVAEEWRLHPDAVATAAEELFKDATSLVLLRFARRIEVLAEVSSTIAHGDELGVERVVEFAGEHFFEFGGHGDCFPRTDPGPAGRGLGAV